MEIGFGALIVLAVVGGFFAGAGLLREFISFRSGSEAATVIFSLVLLSSCALCVHFGPWWLVLLGTFGGGAWVGILYSKV